MTRLHELKPEQLEAWLKARMEAGRERYRDAHMLRYGLVDIAEELLDAINIATLGIERASAGVNIDAGVHYRSCLRLFREHMWREIEALQKVDALTPPALCTDERGGRRTWWSEQGEGDGE